MSDRMIRDPSRPGAGAALSLHVRPSILPRFFPLCQQGFLVKVPGSGSIRTILCRHLSLAPDYLEGRIRTIFLNGKPVDEIDTAIVGPGDTLALSAAMPGLVGAYASRGIFGRLKVQHQPPRSTPGGTRGGVPGEIEAL